MPAFGWSYRDVEELLIEQGVKVDQRHDAGNTSVFSPHEVAAHLRRHAVNAICDPKTDIRATPTPTATAEIAV